MSEYTPGPWRVIDETDVLALEGTPSAIVVAATKFFEGPATTWERANAQLIADAPDLLALVLRADSMLSLLRHRASIRWGAPTLPSVGEADVLIGELRRAYERQNP